jgi:hypothetical protein
MSVTEPVRAHVGGNPGPLAGLFHNPQDARAFERLSRTGREQWRVGGRQAAQCGELTP